MSPLRLLVIEDSHRDRQLFRCLIEDFHEQNALPIACDVVGSGPQALERLRQAHYDAVVLDQNMPEMSGSEVLSALRALFCDGRDRPKVLAYSTCDLPEFRRQCLAEGADAFAAKYMGPQELARALRELGLANGGSGPAP